MFAIFAGYRSFITLGKQFDNNNCMPFTLSRGGEERGLCNQPTGLLPNTREAHGLPIYWQAEETYKGRKLILKGSALQLFKAFHANVIWQHGAGNIFLCFDVSINRFISAQK